MQNSFCICILLFSILISIDSSNAQYWTFIGPNQATEGIRGAVSGAMVIEPGTENLIVGTVSPYSHDGTFLNYLGKWNKTNWSSFLGGCLNVAKMINFNGNVLAISNSACDGAGYGIAAQINSTSWSPVGKFNGISLNGTLEGLTADNGSIYVSGFNLQAAGNASVSYLAKFNGTYWSSFGSPNNYYASSTPIAVDALNRFWIGGHAWTSIGGINCSGLAMFNGSWSCQSTSIFNQKITFTMSIVANSSDTTSGSIFISGWVFPPVTVYKYVNGILTDLLCPIYAKSMAWSSAKQILYVAGQNKAYAPEEFGQVASFDGLTWDNMQNGLIGGSIVSNVIVDLLGNAYFAGDFLRSSSGVCVSGIIKWVANNDTQQPPTPPALNSGFKNIAQTSGGFSSSARVISSLAIHQQSNVMFYGSTSTIFEGSYFRAFNFNLNSYLNFNVNLTNIGEVHSIKSVPEGIFILGNMPRVGNILFWNAATQILDGFNNNNGTNGRVYTAARNFSSGDTFFGGYFSKIIGNDCLNLAKWNGSQFQNWNPQVGGNVWALAFDNDFNLYVGGEFTMIGLVSVNYVSKFDGSVFTSLSGGGLGNPVLSLAFDSYKNTLWIQGTFYGTFSSPTFYANSVAKYNVSADLFESLPFSSEIPVVNSVIMANGSPFFSTDFGIWFWNGTNFSSITKINTNSGVRSMFVHNNSIYFGGVFSRCDVCLTNPARFDLSYVSLPPTPAPPTPIPTPQPPTPPTPEPTTAQPTRSQITTETSISSENISTSSSENSGSIVGIVLGVIFGVLCFGIILFVVLFILYKRRKNNGDSTDHNLDPIASDPSRRASQRSTPTKSRKSMNESVNRKSMTESAKSNNSGSSNNNNANNNQQKESQTTVYETLNTSTNSMKNSKKQEIPNDYLNESLKLNQNNTIYANQSVQISTTTTVGIQKQQNVIYQNTLMRAEINEKTGLRIISASDLKISEKQLGKGAFGIVYAGVFKETLQVAVKEFQVESITLESGDFLGEAKLMSKLAEHPNVVTLIGVVEGPPLKIVTELLGGGNLWWYISANKGKIENMNQKMNWCLDVAKGMKFLNAEGIIHRDLAARNVLLDGNLNAKVADFGLSKAIASKKDSIYYASNVGPVRWMAPESMEKSKFSEKSDVWSWGVMCCFEVFKEEQPYAEITENLVVASKVMHLGMTPNFPNSTPASLKNMQKALFALDPDDRPSFSVIIPLLEA